MLWHDVQALEREQDPAGGGVDVELEDAAVPELACPDDRLSGVADDLEVGAEGIPDAGDLVDADPDVVGAHRGDDDALPVELRGASVTYLVGAHMRAGHAESVSHGVLPTSRSETEQNLVFVCWPLDAYHGSPGRVHIVTRCDMASKPKFRKETSCIGRR